MSGIIQSRSQVVRSPHSTRLRTAAVVAAVVAAFALAAVLALAIGEDAPPRQAAPPAAVESTITQPGIRYDGGPEEGTWRVAPNAGRYDGGPDEGTRGPGH